MKKSLRLPSLIILIIIACLYIGCDGCSVLGGKKEGIIIFEVTYPKPPAEAWKRMMMPDDMEMKFKDDKYYSNLNFSGAMDLSFYVDNSKKEVTEYVKIMSDKMAYTTTDKDLTQLLMDVPKHTVKFVEDENKDIAGYSCKKAIVTVESKTPYSFDVYYTTDIALTNPNWCTPFKEIPGTLMEYQIEKFDVIMRFTAKEVKKLEQTDADFQLPEGTKMKTHQYINDVLLEWQK